MASVRGLITPVLVGVVVACSAERPHPERSESVASELVKGDAVVPRIASMTLQMLKAGSGRLALQLTEASNEELQKAGSFTLVDRDDSKNAYTFNDQGTNVDSKARDGWWSSQVPVDLDRLAKIAGEVAKSGVKSIDRYDFQSGNFTRTVKLPPKGLDLDGLRSGKVVDLPPLTSVVLLPSTGAAFAGPVDPARSLLIRSLSVVEDPLRTRNPCVGPAPGETPGIWTFAHVMEELAVASGLTASEFTERWLSHFAAAVEVRDASGSVTLDAVSGVSAANLENLVIAPWRARSGGGALNLSLAPFRLLSILYRPDLADGQYATANLEKKGAGEVHLLFGLLRIVDQNADGDALDAGDTCSAADMTAIFEYSAPITSCNGIKAYANDWGTLSTLSQGSPEYAALLSELTEGVVTAGSEPSAPDRTALVRLRTNEQALTGAFQLREFQLDADAELAQVTLRNNPREHQNLSTVVPVITPAPYSLNATNLLRDEIVAHVGTINCTGYVFPEFVQGQPFLSGGADYTAGSYWDHPGLTTSAQITARFKVSLNTCTGCHSGETVTNFFHVRPASPGTAAAVSPFLFNSPYSVTDPRGIVRSFNEMDRRKQSLTALANRVCPVTPKDVLAFDFEWSRLANAH